VKIRNDNLVLRYRCSPVDGNIAVQQHILNVYYKLKLGYVIIDD